MQNRKSHWENVYQTKTFEQVSWFQEVPTTSIYFFEKANLAKNLPIIDIGGGESRFVNYLVENHYENITILDISETAIKRKQEELGEAAKNIDWIISDITEFRPTQQYAFWHDRAAFHFLTEEQDIQKYRDLVENFIQKNGTLLIGTFSETGAKKCSGLEIKQYSEIALNQFLEKDFEKIECLETQHQTPFDTIQNFIFCSFKKI